MQRLQSEDSSFGAIHLASFERLSFQAVQPISSHVFLVVGFDTVRETAYFGSMKDALLQLSACCFLLRLGPPVDESLPQ